jgi:hypothetical protein
MTDRKLSASTELAVEPATGDLLLVVDVSDTTDAATGTNKKILWSTIKAIFAVTAKGVTNGDTHNHAGGDGAQIDHGGLAGLADDDHTQYIKHSLATAANDFLAASGTGVFIKKTLAEVKTILGLGTAAYTASGDYAVAAKGVTNGDSHAPVGGDGAQIDHGGLAGLADDDHTQYIKHSLATAANDFLVASGSGAFVKNTLAQVLTLIGKAAASGLASLDGSSKVVQDPANATPTATASKIPIADGSGKLDTWLSDASDIVKGKVELATAAETTTGTDAARAVTPDGLAGSDYGKRLMEIKVMDDVTVVTTGDGKIIFCIPSCLNGFNLVAAHAFVTTVSSSGLPTVSLLNVTDSVDMLSTNITIDANEYTSYTAATSPVIDTAHDDVATGDLIEINVDVAGTGAKGLGVILSFQLP